MISLQESTAVLTPSLGGEDYDDMIYLVDKTKPIPDPSALFPLGSASLFDFSGCRRRFKKS
jgi:hypothetical protein